MRPVLSFRVPSWCCVQELGGYLKGWAPGWGQRSNFVEIGLVQTITLPWVDGY